MRAPLDARSKASRGSKRSVTDRSRARSMISCNAGAPGAARDQHAIERAAGAQCLANRMDSGNHVAPGWRLSWLCEPRSLAGHFTGLRFGLDCWWMFRSLQCKEKVENCSMEFARMSEACQSRRPANFVLKFPTNYISALARSVAWLESSPMSCVSGRRNFLRSDPRNPARVIVCTGARTWSWCWKSSACCTTMRYTIEGARKYLDSRSTGVGSQSGCGIRRKPSRPQPALFGDSAPSLDAIRKELTEILSFSVSPQGLRQ